MYVKKMNKQIKIDLEEKEALREEIKLLKKLNGDLFQKNQDWSRRYIQSESQRITEEHYRELWNQKYDELLHLFSEDERNVILESIEANISEAELRKTNWQDSKENMEIWISILKSVKKKMEMFGKNGE